MYVEAGRCPKCGGRMLTYMSWCGTMPAPKWCTVCGYME